MPGALEFAQQIFSITRHVSDLQTRMENIERSLQQFQEKTQDHFREVEVELATLKGTNATIRETIRAEVAEAWGEARVQLAKVEAELRVRYAEEIARQSRPPLSEGTDQS